MSIKILFFTAPWCGTCKILKPIINEVHKELNLPYELIDVNTSEGMSLASKYQIKTVPKVLLIKDSEIIDVYTGDNYKTWITKNIKLIN